MIAYSIINTFFEINLCKHKKQYIIAVKKIGIQRLYFYLVVNVDSLVSSFITMRDTVTCVSILLQNIVKCQSLGWIITIIICNQFFCYFVMTMRILFDARKLTSWFLKNVRFYNLHNQVSKSIVPDVFPQL